MNLAINYTVTNVEEVRQFCEQLERIYVFVSSAKHWAVLSEIKHTNFAKKEFVQHDGLPVYRLALDATSLPYFDVIKTLTYLSLNGKRNMMSNVKPKV